ncbi:MAG: sensor histidine kinase, partial [Sulfurimonas sp.]|nr:sensor histidine kinase [Sulfurimonas sp.]
MRQHAVLITVLFALTVTIISVSVVFWEFFILNKQHYVDHIFTKHATITQIFRQHQQKQDSQIMLEVNLAVYSFVLEKNNEAIKTVLKNAKILKKKDFQSVKASLMFSQEGVFTKKTVTDLTVTMLEFN